MWFICIFIYLLHVYTDKLPDLPLLRFHCLINNLQKKVTIKWVINRRRSNFSRPVAHSTPVPSEVLYESDDDLMYMGMDTGDSANVGTGNDVIIIDEQDDQKDTKVTDMKKINRNLHSNRSKKPQRKLKNKLQLQYKTKVKENLHKQYNKKRNQSFHKGNHFSNFSNKE